MQEVMSSDDQLFHDIVRSYKNFACSTEYETESPPPPGDTKALLVNFNHKLFNPGYKSDYLTIASVNPFTSVASCPIILDIFLHT